MNSKRQLPSAHRALATAALAAFALANPAAQAAPVWNVNIGDEITTGDNFIGAAAENTANSFWNSVMIANPSAMALKDSTDTASTATLTLTGPQTHTGGDWAAVDGPEIFDQWLKDPANATPISMTIGGLAAGTYDLIVYSDFYWRGGDDFPVTQTAGTGLTGTAYLNNISIGDAGVIPSLVQDTAFGLGDASEGNWMRITGLTPDGGGNLGFNMGGTNAAFNGFQLVEVSAIPEPSSSALLGGLFGLALLRRRR